MDASMRSKTRFVWRRDLKENMDVNSLRSEEPLSLPAAPLTPKTLTAASVHSTHALLFSGFQPAKVQGDDRDQCDAKGRDARHSGGRAYTWTRQGLLRLVASEGSPPQRVRNGRVAVIIRPWSRCAALPAMLTLLVLPGCRGLMDTVLLQRANLTRVCIESKRGGVLRG
ncbi:hypothetical protein OH76DRAFT_1254343 [Lentinus brumalis]|uniref:Uncharacterized protein n=1 Tax=Lentinus brumalis TaxID=2498619 RepID=A0A371CRI4_9APHY|nr:hypothetical protein OH76DRAFT_1254343 [Polyporus brumalis]